MLGGFFTYKPAVIAYETKELLLPSKTPKAGDSNGP